MMLYCFCTTSKKSTTSRSSEALGCTRTYPVVRVAERLDPTGDLSTRPLETARYLVPSLHLDTRPWAEVLTARLRALIRQVGIEAETRGHACHGVGTEVVGPSLSNGFQLQRLAASRAEVSHRRVTFVHLAAEVPVARFKADVLKVEGEFVDRWFSEFVGE